MNKELKAIIESAKPYEEGKLFDDVLIISAGKQYNGFWGKNDYNNIILVARNRKTHENYILKHDIDVVSLYKTPYVLGMDIPKELNCVRMFSWGAQMTFDHYACSDVGLLFHKNEPHGKTFHGVEIKI